MTLLQYCQTLFLKDLGTLEFKCPNSHQTLGFSRPFITPTTKFFGGCEWENMENDLSKINVENRKYFCICLFTMVCADENMYAYFKENYELFSKKTNYPKFGWLGFGIHFEKPCYLLSTPKEVDFDSIPEIEIKDYILYQFTISSSFLGNITAKEFFTKMIDDEHFNCESEIFKKIVNNIKAGL